MNIKSSENRSPKNNIGKSKYLWKAIKSLGLPNKSGGYIVFIQTWQGIYCQNFRSLQIDIQLNLSHYLSLSENFKLDTTTEGYLFNILKNVEVTKVAGIDQISGKFLKDGAEFWQNLLVSYAIFPRY